MIFLLDCTFSCTNRCRCHFSLDKLLEIGRDLQVKYEEGHFDSLIAINGCFMNLKRRIFLMGLSSLAFAKKEALKACGVVTVSQTKGPFYPEADELKFSLSKKFKTHQDFKESFGSDLTLTTDPKQKAKGQVVELSGVIQNQECRPVSGASVFIWQASETGFYPHEEDDSNLEFTHPESKKKIIRKHDPNFQYMGHYRTGKDGVYKFKTIIPGFYPIRVNDYPFLKKWYRPPHIHFEVIAESYKSLVTQMYFDGDDLPNADFVRRLNRADGLLQSFFHSKEEKEGLVAHVERDKASGKLRGRFNITL